MRSQRDIKVELGIPEDKFIEVNGLNLHYLDWGNHNKPTMLLLHGACAHAHWWDFFALSLREDYHIVALDQRGHGDSEWSNPPAYQSLNYVSDIEEFIEKVGLEDIVLIGHSMGGHNSMVYGGISKSNKLKSLVIVDSLAYVDRLEDEEFYRRLKDYPLPIYNTLEEAIERFRLAPEETFASPEILRHIAHYSVKQLPSGKWKLKFDKNAFLFWFPLDVRDYIGNIECPMIFVRGVKSSVVPRDKAEEIVSLCPRGKLVEIKRAYHHVFLDNALEFEEAIKGWLVSLENTHTI
jgi:pimeloyl-ACP methyl ester carboxylesterase